MPIFKIKKRIVSHALYEVEADTAEAALAVLDEEPIDPEDEVVKSEETIGVWDENDNPCEVKE